MTIHWTDTTPKTPYPLGQWQCRVALASANLPHVVISREALEQAKIHLAQLPVEQGGLLLGRVFRSHDQIAPEQFDCVEVTYCVPATQSAGTALSLRMEAQVWQSANEQCAQMGHGNRIVGWYHSHPGLGAFFSQTDCQTQAAFFNHAFSVGLVIDPNNDDLAGFLGAASMPIYFNQPV
jgi:proteasome lid subunit RPN8/RPN11